MFLFYFVLYFTEVWDAAMWMMFQEIVAVGLTMDAKISEIFCMAIILSQGLTTGGLPTFIDVGNSFGAPAILEDNLIYQVHLQIFLPPVHNFCCFCFTLKQIIFQLELCQNLLHYWILPLKIDSITACSKWEASPDDGG